MANFLKLFVLLFAFQAHALVAPSGVPSIQLGGSNLNGYAITISETNPLGWFTLHAGGSVTANQFRAFTKSGGSQYQVPSGGITCYHMTYNLGSSTYRFQLASSTAADGLTVASLTASGAKYESGGASSGFLHAAPVTATEYDKSIVYSFDASSYPYITGDTTGVYSVILTCKPN